MNSIVLTILEQSKEQGAYNNSFSIRKSEHHGFAVILSNPNHIASKSVTAGFCLVPTS
jgi:hypothetical protein